MRRPLCIPRLPDYRPDPERPLRNEPVRRDEVRIYDGRVTMPLGTYRVEERGRFVAVPGLCCLPNSRSSTTSGLPEALAETRPFVLRRSK
jgi:hypothetical protein